MRLCKQSPKRPFGLVLAELDKKDAEKSLETNILPKKVDESSLENAFPASSDP